MKFKKGLWKLFGFIVLTATPAVVIWKVNSHIPEFARYQFFKIPRAPAQNHSRPPRPSTVLYKLKNTATEEQKQTLENVFKRFGMTTHKHFVRETVHFAKSTTNETEESLTAAIVETGAVEFAELDKWVPLTSVPNDPYVGDQWHLPAVHAFESWKELSGKKVITVATCDTGVESSHQDLAENLILPGYNSEDGSNNSEPIHPHGTMTAGTIAATINNRTGVAGVAQNVKILPIRISNSPEGGAYFSAMAACIEYAADHGAKIVNLSYGGADSYTIDTAAQYLRSKGGLLVMSAGNDGRDISPNPDFKSFVIVGATDQNSNRASWSNFGTPIDIVAPGVDIFTTAVGNTYAWASGTSFSAPIVSGVAAMVYALNPNFRPDEVETLLFSSATPLGQGIDDPNFGSGKVDALQTLRVTKEALRSGKKPVIKHHRRLTSTEYSRSE